jgi:hypothetical protein
MLRERTMAQEGPSVDSKTLFKIYAERERQMRLDYMETFYVQSYVPDEEAPLELPQTTCIVIEPVRLNIFSWFT